MVSTQTQHKLPKTNVDLINTLYAFKMILFSFFGEKADKKGKKKNQCINLVIKKALLQKIMPLLCF